MWKRMDRGMNDASLARSKPLHDYKSCVRISRMHYTYLTLFVMSLLVFSGCIQSPPPGVDPSNNNTNACTAEAKICPDGTAVGRIGPNCEFAPCPVHRG